MLEYLKKPKDFIINPCDKNLGPAIIEREMYIKSILNEHLLKGEAYTKLTLRRGRGGSDLLVAGSQGSGINCTLP